MTEEPRKPRHRNGVLSTRLAGEIILYDPQSSQAAALNTTACAIWELCDGTRTVEQICAEIGQQYGVPCHEIRTEIGENVACLFQLGMLCE
jgi:hypothetical protein